MDINPLIADLNKYQDELIDSIMMAVWFKELHRADRFVADSIAEIKGQKHSIDPFKQVADIYDLPFDEVVINIRRFTNKAYKTLLFGNPKLYGDINFDSI
jgi:hypothetical protein